MLLILIMQPSSGYHYLLPIEHELETIFLKHGFALTKAPGLGWKFMNLRCGYGTTMKLTYKPKEQAQSVPLLTQ